MTGFGRGSAERGTLRVAVEIRGVNQKGLDLHLRLPAPFLRHEMACRERVRERVARGRVDVSVALDLLGPSAVQFSVAEGVAKAAGQTAERLRTEGLLERGLTFSDLMNLPDAVSVRLAPEAEEEAKALLLEALAAALDGFCATRRAEGTRLLAQFDSVAASMREGLGLVRPLQTAQVEGARERLLQRLGQLQVETDPGRLEQEVALAAQRCDVSEEVERLEAHLVALAKLLREEGGDQGRRLDHLLQEMQREISTLLAKSASLDLTRAGMSLRLAAEQLREQAQNVA